MNHPNTTASGSEKIPLDVIDYFQKIARTMTTAEKYKEEYQEEVPQTEYEWLNKTGEIRDYYSGVDDGAILLARSFLGLYWDHNQEEVAKCSSCNNKSKVRADGKWYCGVHAPK